jgi:serine/threonine-protein kinase
VAYYLITGQHVFEGATVVELCSHHLHSQPIPPSTRLGQPLPQTLSGVLMACLEKKPERRPPSAQALIELLGGCQDVEPWTSDMGREWWRARGPHVMAQAFDRRAAARELTSVPTTSFEGSILRPKDVRRPL